jgi:hypothetical protein
VARRRFLVGEGVSNILYNILEKLKKHFLYFTRIFFCEARSCLEVTFLLLGVRSGWARLVRGEGTHLFLFLLIFLLFLFLLFLFLSQSRLLRLLKTSEWPF